nr:hypothetical protein [Pajaroellobacter abortibovis]
MITPFRIRMFITSLIGSIFERYGFALFGYFSLHLGKLFFPSTDSMNEVISSLGVFAAGFLVRPLGWLIFGYIGDRFGRKQAMLMTIFYVRPSPPPSWDCFPPTSKSVPFSTDPARPDTNVARGLCGGQLRRSDYLRHRTRRKPEPRFDWESSSSQLSIRIYCWIHHGYPRLRSFDNRATLFVGMENPLPVWNDHWLSWIYDAQ